MIGRITSYLQNWWNRLTKLESHQIAVVVGIFGSCILFAFLFAFKHYNPNLPTKSLGQRLAILETNAKTLISNHEHCQLDLDAAKQQIHTLTQSLITITSDLSALNAVINSDDLSYTYNQDVENVRIQIDKNMKTISAAIPEILGDE